MTLASFLCAKKRKKKPSRTLVYDNAITFVEQLLNSLRETYNHKVSAVADRRSVSVVVIYHSFPKYIYTSETLINRVKKAITNSRFAEKCCAMNFLNPKFMKSGKRKFKKKFT